MKIMILIPVYNDWQSVSKLLDEINSLPIDSQFQISVIIVNDASNHDRQDEDNRLEDHVIHLHALKLLVGDG